MTTLSRPHILLALVAASAAGGFYGASCVDPVEKEAAAAIYLLRSQLSGAIFTTTEDGSRVNANIYPAKEDVYLDGGPGPNAPAGAAGLPAGDYYFQVTDPSGKTLLSTDHISCRRVRINEAGVIDFVYEGTDYVKVKGQLSPTACRHAQGVDGDHHEEGAITVQLMPYDDTPNPGGVYKAWLTPTHDYAGDPDAEPTTQGGGKKDATLPGFHGFIPSRSKTDNYKVERKGKPFDPMALNVHKFHDADMDGTQNGGEPDIEGWEVEIIDPLGASNNAYTPIHEIASEGTWLTIEATPEGTLQTVAYLDGSKRSEWPAADPIVSVIFDGNSGETHEVRYGDVGLGSLDACKRFDRDGDGEVDEGEPPVPGWRVSLSGTTLRGDEVGALSAATSGDGCALFANLLPGHYTVTEEMPQGDAWKATGETTSEFDVASTLDGSVLSGTATEVSFTNTCRAHADFGTKGYWHNKNGLGELGDDDLAYVNGLAPYASPSSYFGAGDEPFDGELSDGSPVAAAHGEAGEEIAPAGSAKAEVSHFLVDSNTGADPREQLAQQLLAFIFNVRHRFDGQGALIELADGSLQDADALIEEAIDAWSGGDAATRGAMAQRIDALNNSDALPYVPAQPCAVTYPE